MADGPDQASLDREEVFGAFFVFQDAMNPVNGGPAGRLIGVRDGFD